MMKALRLCEPSVTLSTPHVKPRSLYQLYHRIASIHHRLASLYHNSYRNQVRLSKKLLWFLSEKEKVLSMNLEMNDPVPWCIMSVLGRELVCVFLTVINLFNDKSLIGWPIDRCFGRSMNWEVCPLTIPTDGQTDWLADWLSELLFDWLADRLADWLTDLLIYWLTDYLTDLLTGWLAG